MAYRLTTKVSFQVVYIDYCGAAPSMLIQFMPIFPNSTPAAGKLFSYQLLKKDILRIHRPRKPVGKMVDIQTTVWKIEEVRHEERELLCCQATLNVIDITDHICVEIIKLPTMFLLFTLSFDFIVVSPSILRTSTVWLFYFFIFDRFFSYLLYSYVIVTD
jgi:hypothetical protein